MKQFVMLYYVQDMAKGGEMEAWMKWFESFGGSIVDSGEMLLPGGVEVMGPKKEVTTMTQESWPASGYTVIEAKDMDAAVEIAKGCPLFAEDEGGVRLYERAQPIKK